MTYCTTLLVGSITITPTLGPPNTTSLHSQSTSSCPFFSVHHSAIPERTSALQFYAILNVYLQIILLTTKCFFHLYEWKATCMCCVCNFLSSWMENGATVGHFPADQIFISMSSLMVDVYNIRWLTVIAYL